MGSCCRSRTRQRLACNLQKFFYWLQCVERGNLSSRILRVTDPMKGNTYLNDDDLKFVGGALCLDFVNTVDVWASSPGKAHSREYGDTPVKEKLVDYKALVHWGQLAGVLSAQDADRLLHFSANHPQDAASTLSRALRLRRAIYRILKSVLQRWEPECSDLDVLHRDLAIARKHERLAYRDGIFHWTWDSIDDALDSMLWPVARSAAEVLTSADLSRLRQCRADECGWIFLDTSRNRSRHWCDMSDCGNLDKVRRFRMKR